jgi:hypothetical protein
MPNWRWKVDRASTMRASIEICGVWVSSAIASSRILRRASAMSLMISALVRLSTSSLPFSDSIGVSFSLSSSALA